MDCFKLWIRRRQDWICALIRSERKRFPFGLARSSFISLFLKLVLLLKAKQKLPIISHALFRVAIMNVLLLLLVSGSYVYAEAKSPTIKTDSSEVSLRHFDANALRQYKQDRDFIYSDAGGDVSPSAWTRFWVWVWREIRELLRAASGIASPDFWQYLLIFIVSGVVIYAVIKFSGMDITTLLTGKPKEVEVPYTESLENIHEISFDEEIERALSNHDYRLAVRLLYLKSLKKLSDAGVIHWETDKTNAAYIREIKNAAQRERFVTLTREFEYVWYGNFPVDPDRYKRISADFVDFYRGGYR